MNAAARPRIAVIDYGMGNRRSVEKALSHVGADAVVTGSSQELVRADALVLPGVGAYPKGMSNLRERGLDQLLRESALTGTPVLGICLGMQLLFDSSTEMGMCTGLGLIPGNVRPLRGGGLRVPHIGWNDVALQRPCDLTAGLPAEGRPFYHVHSYVSEPADEGDVIGTSEYGERFATIVKREHVYGTQFHPEKSSIHGLQLLSAFTALAARARAERR